MESIRLTEFLKDPLAEGVPDRLGIAKSLSFAWTEGTVANPEIGRLRNREDLNFLSHSVGVEGKIVGLIYARIQRVLNVSSVGDARNEYSLENFETVPSKVVGRKALGDISLYEQILDCYPSTRLRHCVLANPGVFEKITAKEFHEYDKASKAHCLRHVPNLGKKTVAEIADLISDSISGVKVDPQASRKLRASAFGPPAVEKNKTSRPASLSKRAQRKLQLESVLGKLQTHAEWPSIALLEQFYEIATSPGDKEIIAQRLAGKTLHDIGLQFGCSRERVRQREKRALQNLKAFLNDDFLELSDRLRLELVESNGQVSSEYLKARLDARDCSDLAIFVFARIYLDSVKFVSGAVVSTALESGSSGIDSLWPSFLSKDWPVNISDLLADTEVLDQDRAINFFSFDKNAVIDSEGFITSATLNRSEEIVFALRSIGGRGDTESISLAIEQLFGVKRNERNLRRTMARMSQAVMLGRGIYALLEAINLDDQEIQAIRDDCVRFLSAKGSFVSAKLLCRELDVDFNIATDPAYLLYSILQDDQRLLFGRGLMVSTKSAASKGAFNHSLQDQIEALLEGGEGFSVAQIEALLYEDGRVVHPASIRGTLDSSELIVRVDRGRFSLKSKVLDVYQESFFLCAELLLFNSKRSVFDLTSKMLCVTALENVRPLNDYVVRSLLDKHPSFVVKNDYCELITPSPPVRQYREEGIASSSMLIKLDFTHGATNETQSGNLIRSAEEDQCLLDEVFGAFEQS